MCGSWMRENLKFGQTRVATWIRKYHDDDDDDDSGNWPQVVVR